MLHWQLDCQTESQADPYRFVWFHTSSKARFLIHTWSRLSLPCLIAVSVRTHFCFILTAKRHHSIMSTRKEYGVDKRAQEAAQFYVECNKNPNTKLKIPAAMRAKGYSDDDAAARTLQAQVCRAAEKI